MLSVTDITIARDGMNCHHYDRRMGRWEPDAKGRLRAAALELFVRQGYEQTTAAEIAEAVGLTERTFFRHFTDKREVLFDGSDELLHLFVDAAAAAPPEATPFEVVVAALAGSAEFFADDRRDWSRRRTGVIQANPALRERELLKMTGLGEVLARVLRDRGVADAEATLSAQLGVTVFTVAFEQWIDDEAGRSLVEIEHDVVRRMRGLTAGIPG